MRILIVGMGKVGSVIAWSLVLQEKKKIDILDLYDIDKKKLKGEVLDLAESNQILKKKIQIGLGKQTEYDICIIAAGKGRKKFKETDNALYKKNRLPVLGSIYKFKARKYLIITNPPGKLAKEAEKIRWNREIIPVGLKLDRARIELGHISSKAILETKGYTCWGVAAEVLRRIYEDEKGD